MDLWESGELVPTYEQVELLAELTSFPVKFFYLEPFTWPTTGALFVCSRQGCERIPPPAAPEPPRHRLWICGDDT